MILPRFFQPLGALLTVALFAGCGGGQEAADVKPAGEDEGAAVSAGDTGRLPASADPPDKPAAEPPETAQAETNPPSEVEPEDSPGDQLIERGLLFARVLGESERGEDAAVTRLDQDGIEAKRSAGQLLKSSTDLDTRLGAAFYLLDRFDEADPVQNAGVVAALGDEDASIRNIALQLVLRSQTMTVDNLPVVAGLLNDATAAESSRIKAIRGLAKMPQEAARVVEQIRQAAKESKEPKVRAAAVYAISRVDGGAEGGAVLVDRLQKDDAASVRQLAAARLGRLEEAVGVDALAAALADPDIKVRESAADSLGRLKAPAVPALISKLDAQSADVRRLAIYALGKSGAAALPSLPKLRKLAESDPDTKVQELAKLTLRVIQTAN